MSSSESLHQAATCAYESLSCLYSIHWFEDIKAIDWYNEIRLVGTATVLSSIIVGAIFFIDKNYPNLYNGINLPSWIRLPKWTWLRNLIIHFNLLALLPESELSDLSRGRVRTCPPPRTQSSPYEPSHRTTMGDKYIRVYAWPSKGGVIILDHVEAVDLEFLGLDPLNPPAKRLPNQTHEDTFCRRLLLLGAKWWDSEARFWLLESAMGDDSGCYRARLALEDGTEPNPSIKERRWVSVAWPTTGGLWVAEFDTFEGEFVDEEDNSIPSETIRLKFARTMDEKSKLLREYFKAKFYMDVRDYKGHAFLNGWEERSIKEVDN